MDLRVTTSSDRRLFEEFASCLQLALGGTWTTADGADQRYWDLTLDSRVLTLHLEHYLGISISVDDPDSETSDRLLERAVAVLPEQEEWTFKITFTDLFCPKYEGQPMLTLAKDLSEDDNHIHARLEICVHGRLLPRMGFWGPHDVCLNTWLRELDAALRQLETTQHTSFVSDEGEQGQPAFRFRRDSTSLFISVEASALSGGAGEPDWQEVCCDYEDFRLQVFRFRGRLREALENELGPEKAELWLIEVSAV